MVHMKVSSQLGFDRLELMVEKSTTCSPEVRATKLKGYDNPEWSVEIWGINIL